MSRKGYTANDGATNENLNTSALMRIADATEAMAADYVKLRKDKELYERWWREERAKTEGLNKTIVALKGHVTRLKRKVEKMRMQTAPTIIEP